MGLQTFNGEGSQPLFLAVPRAGRGKIATSGIPKRPKLLRKSYNKVNPRTAHEVPEGE